MLELFELTDEIDQRMSTFSKGMKQKVLIEARTIDSGIETGRVIPVPSAWTLQDVTLYANRCQNLGKWTVNQTVDAPGPPRFDIRDYLQTSEIA